MGGRSHAGPIVVVWGPPSAGLRALRSRLREEGLAVLTVDALRDPAFAARFRAFWASGRLVPDDAWLDAVVTVLPEAPVVLVGPVRSGAQLRLLAERTRRPMAVVYVDAAITELDEERRRMGLPPVEVGHPGVTERWEALRGGLAEAAASLDVAFVSVRAAEPSAATAEVVRLLRGG